MFARSNAQLGGPAYAPDRALRWLATGAVTGSAEPQSALADSHVRPDPIPVEEEATSIAAERAAGQVDPAPALTPQVCFEATTRASRDRVRVFHRTAAAAPFHSG